MKAPFFVQSFNPHLSKSTPSAAEDNALMPRDNDERDVQTHTHVPKMSCTKVKDATEEHSRSAGMQEGLKTPRQPSKAKSGGPNFEKTQSKGGVGGGGILYCQLCISACLPSHFWGLHKPGPTKTAPSRKEDLAFH